MKNAKSKPTDLTSGILEPVSAAALVLARELAAALRSEPTAAVALMERLRVALGRDWPMMAREHDRVGVTNATGAERRRWAAQWEAWATYWAKGR